MTRLSCKRVEEALFEFANDKLDESTRSAIVVHLAICENCRAALEICSGLPAAVSESAMEPLSFVDIRRMTSSSHLSQEEAIPARLPRPNFKRIALIALPAAAAIFLLFSGTLDFAKDESFSGPKQASIDTSTHAFPYALREIAPADVHIHTCEVGPGLLQPVDGIVLKAGKDASGSFVPDDTGALRFRLKEGRVVAGIVPAEPYRALVIETPSAEVEAHGTLFSVTVSAHGNEIMRVAEGMVEVRRRRNGKSLTLSPGQEMSSNDYAVRPASIASMSRDIALVRGMDREAHDFLLDERTANGATPQLSGNESAASYQAFNLVDEAQKLAKSEHNLPVDRAILTRLVKQAQSYRKVEMHAAAAKTYEKIIESRPNSETAGNSMVSLGQMKLMFMNRPREALKHFEDYLSTHPGGSLSDVARDGRTRALFALKKTAE